MTRTSESPHSTIMLLHRSIVACSFLALSLVSCGGEESTASSVVASAPGADARLDDARSALMRGELGVAQALAAKLSATGLDEQLLRARIAYVAGDDAKALGIVEALRAAHPEDGRPFATAAELHAAAGRTFAAEDEIERGWAIAGQSPELERARGVLLLSVPGGAVEGLAALEAALEREPKLPYAALPLAQAHLLVGREFLGGAHPELAEQSAHAALEFDPTGVEPRELLAESLAAQLLFRESLKVYDELAAEGRELTVVRIGLHVKAATAALLRKEQSLAVVQYRAARELGATDEELGFGVSVLEKAASRAIDDGLQTLREEPHIAAKSFEEALAFVPEHLEACSYLGHAHYRAGDLEGAASAWTRVLELSGGDVALPEPIHVHLAKALREDGKLDRAIDVLEQAVDERPDDRWRLETSDLLTSLLTERGKR